MDIAEASHGGIPFEDAMRMPRSMREAVVARLSDIFKARDEAARKAR